MIASHWSVPQKNVSIVYIIQEIFANSKFNISQHDPRSDINYAKLSWAPGSIQGGLYCMSLVTCSSCLFFLKEIWVTTGVCDLIWSKYPHYLKCVPACIVNFHQIFNTVSNWQKSDCCISGCKPVTYYTNSHLCWISQWLVCWYIIFLANGRSFFFSCSWVSI